MKTTLLAIAALSTLSNIVFAQSIQNTPRIGDAPEGLSGAFTPGASKSLILQGGVGVTAGMLTAGEERYRVPTQLHFGATVAKKLGSLWLGGERRWWGIGYAMSADIDGEGILHRHGIAITAHRDWLFFTASTGFSLGHAFQGGYSNAGGHVAVNAGVKFGSVQIGVPVAVDFMGPRLTTYGVTLGFGT